MSFFLSFFAATHLNANAHKLSFEKLASMLATPAQVGSCFATISTDQQGKTDLHVTTTNSKDVSISIQTPFVEHSGSQFEIVETNRVRIRQATGNLWTNVALEFAADNSSVIGLQIYRTQPNLQNESDDGPRVDEEIACGSLSKP